MIANVSVVVPAAGKGLRMGSDQPKQYLPLAGTLILERTLRKMLALKPANVCLVVSSDDDQWSNLESAHRCLIAEGGDTRAASVLSGIARLELNEHDWVLVHDAVRPLVLLSDIKHLLESVSDDGGLLAVPVVDTLKQANDLDEVIATPDRSRYWQAQTPQLFQAGKLTRALQHASENNLEITDEASAMEAAGFTPKLIAGQRTNIKITTKEDLAYAEFLLGTEMFSCE